MSDPWPELDPSISHDSTWATVAERPADPEQTPAPGGWVEETLGTAGEVVPATPAFTVTPNPATAGEVIEVDASSSVPGTYPIKTYTWDFGDTGPLIDGVTMTHSYPAGTYTITLTTRDAIGGQATASQDIVVT